MPRSLFCPPFTRYDDANSSSQSRCRPRARRSNARFRLPPRQRSSMSSFNVAAQKRLRLAFALTTRIEVCFRRDSQHKNCCRSDASKFRFYAARAIDGAIFSAALRGAARRHDSSRRCKRFERTSFRAVYRVENSGCKCKHLKIDSL